MPWCGGPIRNHRRAHTYAKGRFFFLHFRFFVYEVTSTKFTRELVKEVLLSVIASIFMGFGTLFLLLWVGIFV